MNADPSLPTTPATFPSENPDASVCRFDSSQMTEAGVFPGFRYYVPSRLARGGDEPTIREQLRQGPPSEGFHRDFFYCVQVGEAPFAEKDERGNPILVEINARLSVDDLGAFTMGPLSIDLPPQGPHGGSPGQSGSDSGLMEQGFYCAFLSYDNIDYKKENNKAVLDFTLNVGPGKVVPVVNDDPPCDCDPCDCDCCCASGVPGDGGPEPGGSRSPSSPNRARTGASVVGSSSGGTRVTATATKNNMLWQANFGAFRGLGGVPGGMLEIAVKEFSPKAWSVSSLTYSHPMAGRIEKPAGAQSIGERNTVVTNVTGARRDSYLVGGDGASVFGVGTNAKTTNAVRLLERDGAGTAVRGNAPKAFMEVKTTAKSSTVYSTSTGLPAVYNTASGRRIPSDEFGRYLNVIRAEDGSIRQIWNLWDGLANIEDIVEDGYAIALYLPGQVGVRDAGTGLYPVTGSPFKTFRIGTNDARDRLVVTERAEGREPYVVSWWQTGKAWSMSRGVGEDEIITRREREELGGNRYRIVTTVMRGMSGEIDSCTSETFESSDEGTLRTEKTAGYGGSSPFKTTYTHDAAGRQSSASTTVLAGKTQSGYDTHSRPSVAHQPWAGGSSRQIYTYYKDGDFYDSDIDNQRIALVKDGNATSWQRIQYAYSTAGHIRRVEKRTSALASPHTQLEVTETWLGTAPNEHAQGRVNMRQTVDGVQTHYAYEETADYGALYRQTEETRVAGELVPGQSTRRVSYVSEQGNDLRTEDYALLPDGTWSLLDAADYEYDRENRWIKRTRANGRVTEREMTCCGPLWEKDEDGVQTTYSYNTARQLVETIRSATETTPETITSYKRDAMDRVIETRVDAGPMTTIEKTSYDLQGRVLSKTDALGRTTTYAYSEDGLTVTETTPSGATLVTRSHPDGTILEQSGAGQRHLIHTVTANEKGLHLTVETPAADGSKRILLSRTTLDGFGHTIREEVPNAAGGSIVTTYRYNEKGQEIERQTESLAPILSVYDSMGTLVRETVKTTDVPTPLNARVTEWTSGFVRRADGVYLQKTKTTYNPEGEPIASSQSELVTLTGASIERKTIVTDVRGQETTWWTEYGEPTVRLRKVQTPDSTALAETILVDGFATVEKDKAGATVTHARRYTQQGLVLTHTDPRGNATVTEEDLAGRIVKETDAAGNTATTVYDPATGQPAVVTDALGNAACFSYDLRGRKIAEYGAGIQPALYGYDEADRVVSLTTFRAPGETITGDPSARADGDATTWQYDEATGLVLVKTYADGNAERSVYDALNRLERTLKARGVTLARTYAPLTGELLSITPDDGTESWNYRYNHLGWLVEVADAAGTLAIAYNRYGQRTREEVEGAVNSLVEEKYDALGRSVGYRLAVEGNVCRETTVGYDPYGRIGSLSVDGETTPYTWNYDAASGLLQTLAYPNGIVRRNAYDARRPLLESISYALAATPDAPDMEYAYAYDELGRPTRCTDTWRGRETPLVSDYQYNNRSELTRMSHPGEELQYSYSYDNIGNRVASREGDIPPSSYVANALNQYTEITSGEITMRLEHDADGNATRTDQWSITYDAYDRPVHFVNLYAGMEGFCRYDSMGRRIEKRMTLRGRPYSHHRYVYRGYLQVAEIVVRDSANCLENLHVWDPAEPVATRLLETEMVITPYGSPVGKRIYLMHDAQKNVTGVYDESGQAQSHYTYEPYGKMAAFSRFGSGNAYSKFQYSSEFWDDELEMNYYNYRYLNPVGGRWITREPIGERGGNNLYAFVLNAATISFDLFGLLHEQTAYYYSYKQRSHQRQARELFDMLRPDLGGKVPGLDNIIEDVEKNHEDGSCIKKLIIDSHGNPNTTMYFENGTFIPHYGDGVAKIKKWGNEIKPYLCPDSIIIITACCAAYSDNVLQALANSTQAKVIAGKGANKAGYGPAGKIGNYFLGIGKPDNLPVITTEEKLELFTPYTKQSRPVRPHFETGIRDSPHGYIINNL